MASDEWSPLLRISREGVAERVVHGAVAWASGDRALHAWGGDPVCYGRSIMKPVMAKALASALDPLLSWPQKALAVASHNGEPFQVEGVRAMLPEPGHRCVAAAHPCSGQHSALLRACQALGWPEGDYGSETHPFYRAYLETLRGILGPAWTPGVVAEDGCGLRTVSMRLSEMARVYAAMAAQADGDWIWEAMVRGPEYVGGAGRVDTEILKACGGRVIAKEGADGLLAMSVKDSRHPWGLGVIIKVAHGEDLPVLRHVASRVLKALGHELEPPAAPPQQDVAVEAGVAPDR